MTEQARNRWEEDIRAFEESDRASPPPRNANLFVGSSSWKFWKEMEADFPGRRVINRGFGGSKLSDVVHFADRIILPYAPAVVLVYAGSHDLHAAKKTPGEVAEEFARLCAVVHDALPDTRVAFVSMKPSRAKWDRIDLDRQTNELIRRFAAETANVEYIDIFSAMCRESAPPPEDLFAPDGNHPSQKCYRLWAEVIAPYLA
jgi:lysophospholipase L1-like esterase